MDGQIGTSQTCVLCKESNGRGMGAWHSDHFVRARHMGQQWWSSPVGNLFLRTCRRWRSGLSDSPFDELDRQRAGDGPTSKIDDTRGSCIENEASSKGGDDLICLQSVNGQYNREKRLLHYQGI